MEELHFSSLFHFVRDDKSLGKPPLLTEIILLRIFREARGSAQRRRRRRRQSVTAERS